MAQRRVAAAGSAFSAPPPNASLEGRSTNTPSRRLGVDSVSDSEDDIIPDSLVGGLNRMSLDPKVLAGVADPSWVNVAKDHDALVAAARAASDGTKPARVNKPKRTLRALGTAETSASYFRQWPRRLAPQGVSPPPVTKEMVEAIQREDAAADPNEDPPPAAQGFAAQMRSYVHRLTTETFAFSPTLSDNPRRAADRIESRISFLPRARVKRVMSVIREGYLIPFRSPPPPFHRQQNGPDLAAHRDAAWKALSKDIAHGAVMPCDIQAQGKPRVVSPVRTAPKGWRSKDRRFVVNMRYINKFIVEDASPCELDTLPRIRNMFCFGGRANSAAWGFTLDLASGYHNFLIHKDQWNLMGIAIHAAELPQGGIDRLRKDFPNCEDKEAGLFYFTMRALPFGLAPSCAVFSDVITALVAAWRRHRVCGHALRISSYIDDVVVVAPTARAALVAAVEILFEMAAAGLTINDKCRLAPSTRFIYLGTVIDTADGTFSLPTKRALRLAIQTGELATATSRFQRVEAKAVASLIGLLWAASPCCPRGVAVMARGLISVLSDELRHRMWCPATWRLVPGGFQSRINLRRLLAVFWSGDVQWNARAAADLSFWLTIDFTRLRAPISADTVNVLLEYAYVNTSNINKEGLAFLASDASAVACGGGVVHEHDGNFSFDDGGIFFSDFPRRIRGASSGLREATAILWMLRSLQHKLPPRILAFTDSQAARNAIMRGSRIKALQRVVMQIFLWSLARGTIVVPVWVPRTTQVIDEADRMSRWSDVFDRRTPPNVFVAANDLARECFGRPISFDRQASHLNVMPPRGMGPKLPFNSLWYQPGSHGVDMFNQPARSWLANVNFIHPAEPTTGRVLTFLQAIKARAVVVIPLAVAVGTWWASFAQPESPGVLAFRIVEGFIVMAVLHEPDDPRSKRHPRPHTLVFARLVSRSPMHISLCCSTSTGTKRARLEAWKVIRSFARWAPSERRRRCLLQFTDPEKGRAAKYITALWKKTRP